MFASKGFFGAKVADIAREAGVADGTIYLYFKKKDDILISLFREKMGEILDRLMHIVSQHDDPESKLRHYISEHLALVAEQPKLMQVLTVELRQSGRFMRDDTHHQPFGRYLAAVGAIIDDGQARGVFRKDVSSQMVSRALFGALDEISLSWVLRPSAEKTPFDRKAAASQLGEFFLRGLRLER